MIRSIAISALAALILPLSFDAMAQTPAPGAHPLVGKWQWTRPQNKCTEVYDFRADGTAVVTSGAEKTDNTYTVAANPDSNGFFRVTVKTTKDHGGKDCADDETDSTGQESTTYVLFDPNRAQSVMCAEPKLERCFGPLQRLRQ